MADSYPVSEPQPEPNPYNPAGLTPEPLAEPPLAEPPIRAAAAPQPDPGPRPAPPQVPTSMYAPQPLSQSDERTWAMLAHLSVLLNLVTGFFGPIAALVIYLIYKDRSRYVAYHSLQSFIMQMILWIGGGLLSGIAWTISGALVAVLGLGCLLMPFALIISLAPVVALVLGVIGAIQTSQGQDFRYWLIGDWVRGTLYNS